MKHLIRFSIDRRFKNKITIILHLLTITIMTGALFSDKIIEYFIPSSSEKIEVYYHKDIKHLFTDEVSDDLFVFKEGYLDESINIYYEDKYIIETKHPLDPLVSLQVTSILSNLISEKWMESLNDQSRFEIISNISPEIVEQSLIENSFSKDKANISMFMITGIYFAMLSFSTMIANEVVYEKTSKVLEIVLTSISTTTHYISKMIVAWMTVIIQMLLILVEVSTIIFIRNLYDEGAGLLAILRKYNLIDLDALTFKDFIKLLDIDGNLIYILAVSLIYMLIGVVLVQIIMVCISSFINSIEESSAIHGPVYIIFLLIYYLALALNSPPKLSSGIGYYLSLTPITSMLFMPMRLLLTKVSIYEILLGILLSLITLTIFLVYGSKVYNFGILGGSIGISKIARKSEKDNN